MPLHRPPSAKGILYLAFNQDNTCISIADDKGIKIYSLETHKVLYQSDLGAVRYAGFIVGSWLEYLQLLQLRRVGFATEKDHSAAV